MAKYAVGMDIGGGHVENCLVDIVNFKAVEGTNVYVEVELKP